MLVLAAALIALLGGCKKDWDKHNAISDELLTLNLFERIAANSNLSTFADLLRKSGYDKVLSSSKNFTVFAPTNAALASLDAAIISDTSRLNPFVANHIANQSYYTTRVTDTARIPFLSNKFHNMLGKKIETATITESDLAAQNGVLQVIDRMLPVLGNIWEVMNNAGFPSKQANYLISLNYQGFDPAIAEQVGVNPQTGEPIYRPGTGVVPRNTFWDKVYDLRQEEMQYTYFAIANTSFDAQMEVYRPYYNPDSTVTNVDSVISFAILKDFAFEGKRELTDLPDTLVAKSGARVGIDKSKITSTIMASNGIVYVMNDLPVMPATKYVSIKIEAEDYISTSHDRRNNTRFRDRINELTGLPYQDVFVSGHGVALYHKRYMLSDMPSMKYRAYWVAVNDFQTANFSQKVGIGLPNSNLLPFVVVTPRNFEEVLLGEFTLPTFSSNLNVYLTGANSTAAAANPLVCDYIRLEPVF